MTSLVNEDVQGRRLERYAFWLVLVAVLLVAAGAAVTVLLWSGTWLVALLGIADLMLLTIAIWFVRVALMIRRRCRLEIRQVDVDGEQMTVHYGAVTETLDLRECRVDAGDGEREGWDFRIRSPKRGVRLLTGSFSGGDALRALLSGRLTPRADGEPAEPD